MSTWHSKLKNLQSTAFSKFLHRWLSWREIAVDWNYSQQVSRDTRAYKIFADTSVFREYTYYQLCIEYAYSADTLEHTLSAAELFSYFHAKWLFGSSRLLYYFERINDLVIKFIIYQIMCTRYDTIFNYFMRCFSLHR